MSTSRCAACTYFRRRCHPDCIFAPYFPATHPEKFEWIHGLFGARNVARTLQELEGNQRTEAVNSMYFEARARFEDPVHGCTKIITQLRQQICEAEVELAKTNEALKFCNAYQAHRRNHFQESNASTSKNP